VQALRAVGAGHIRVDACGYAASAAEGAALALFAYDDNKRAESREAMPTLELLG
jgi:aminopeptidase